MICSIDIETFEKEGDKLKPVLNAQKFSVACLTTGKGSRFFFEKDELWRTLDKMVERAKKRNIRIYMYAHNHQYDFCGYAREKYLNGEIKLINISPFIAVYKERLYMLDSMSFYPMSLQLVGDIIGLPKMELSEEIDNIEEILPYLKRDTEIVLKAMEGIQDVMNELGFNPRKMTTIGQVALNAYITHAKKNKELWMIAREGQIYRTQNQNKLRLAYKGGRNEAFKTGTFENATMLDINSLYPYVMANMKFPDLKSEKIMDKPLETIKLDSLLSIDVGIAKARVKINRGKDQFGYLPVRLRGTLVFPKKCDVRGVWTLEELRNARAEGDRIIEVDWAIIYNTLEKNPFKTFIERLYKLKQESEGVKRHVVKMLLNSLYGKFGQKDRYSSLKIVKRSVSDLLDDKKTKFEGTLGEYYIYRDLSNPSQSRYSNPIISLLVTQGGRDLLYKQIRKAGTDKLIYVDTDSCIIEGKDYKGFNISDEMGAWKIEGEGKECRVLGEKRYYFGDKVKLSGVPRKSITKDLIKEGATVTVKKMHGISDVMHGGRADLMGTFKDVEIKQMEKSKLDIPIPTYIDEVKEVYGDVWN